MAIPVLSLPQMQLPSETLLRAEQISNLESQREARNQQVALEQQQLQQQSQQQAALQQLMREAQQNPQALQTLAAIKPEAAKGIQDYQNNQTLALGRAAMAFKMADRTNKPQVYQRTIKQLQSQGIDVSDLPAEYDPDDEQNVQMINSAVDFSINNARDIEKQIGQRQILETGQGIMTIDPQTGDAIPVTQQGQLLQPYVKPPETQITIDNKAEGKEAEELAKIRANRYKDLMDANDSARRGYETLETLKQAVSNPAAAQGAFASIRGESKKVAELFGFNPEGLEDDAIITSVGNKLALQLRNPKGEDGGLTGATSDKDLKFLVAGVPNKDKTMSQNLAIIEIAQKDKERTQKLAAFADNYLQETGSLQGLERAKREWLENNPLYQEDSQEKKRIKSMLQNKSVEPAQSNKNQIQQANDILGIR